MIEPVCVPEIPITAPGGIYYDDGMLMIPCYKLEVVTEAPHAPAQRVVKVKIFRPASPESVAESIAMMAQCLWPTAAPPPTQPQFPSGFGGRGMHLVR